MIYCTWNHPEFVEISHFYVKWTFLDFWFLSDCSEIWSILSDQGISSHRIMKAERSLSTLSTECAVNYSTLLVCLDGIGIAARLETPQPLWATCSSVWPHSLWKKTNNFVFLTFEEHFPYFIFHPVPLALLLTPLFRVWLCLCCLPSGIYIGEIHPRLDNPSSVSLLCVLCSKSLIILITHYWTHSRVSMPQLHWATQIRTQHPKLSTFCAEGRGRFTSLDLLSMFFFTKGCWLPNTLMTPCQLFIQ